MANNISHQVAGIYVPPERRKHGTKEWKRWFAWRPVTTLSGHRYWLRRIYRREILKTYATINDWTRYEYGDLFDVIKYYD